MTSGLPLSAFTYLHILISLVGIASGLAAMIGLARAKWLPRVHDVFLAATLATTVTGFMFPFGGFTPALGVGIISALVLGTAYLALYFRGLKGRWGIVYAVTGVLSLFLNLFVLIVQSFQKIPPLHSLAPQGIEPPFVAAQGLLLIAMVALGFTSLRSARRRPAPWVQG